MTRHRDPGRSGRDPYDSPEVQRRAYRDREDGAYRGQHGGDHGSWRGRPDREREWRDDGRTGPDGPRHARGQSDGAHGFERLYGNDSFMSGTERPSGEFGQLPPWRQPDDVVSDAYAPPNDWASQGRGPIRSSEHSEFDPDYQQWRSEQMRALDDDYRNWRQDRYKKFSDEFATWRKNRPSTDTSSQALAKGGKDDK